MSKSRKAAQTGSKPLRGKDAVVVVAASEFERLCARGESASLHDLLSQSPLNRLDFGVEGVKSPVREVDL